LAFLSRLRWVEPYSSARGRSVADASWIVHVRARGRGLQIPVQGREDGALARQPRRLRGLDLRRVPDAGEMTRQRRRARRAYAAAGPLHAEGRGAAGGRRRARRRFGGREAGRQSVQARKQEVAQARINLGRWRSGRSGGKTERLKASELEPLVQAFLKKNAATAPHGPS
jgi:hypothetical protein